MKEKHKILAFFEKPQSMLSYRRKEDFLSEKRVFKQPRTARSRNKRIE
jgi:hypothetical protein